MPAQSKEEGLGLLRDLVARFAAQEQYYRGAEFDETSTREQFINGLFFALGWDVVDAAGLGPRREVVFHPRLVDEGQAAGQEEWDDDLTAEELAAREPVALVPDYAFRVGDATRFFVEAKRAGRSLDARGPAFQVKTYAWNHGVRVGVLTNFRQLRIFETLNRPVYEQPRSGLLNGLELDYTQYEAHWDAIWDLLSRPAVYAGSIEQSVRARRGNVPVDEAFLAELTEWRETLAADIAARNVDLDRWAVAEATQRILDRLVFLRVCEDRTVEQQVVLRRYARITDAYRQMEVEFRRLDQTYNGALFARHFSERLEVSDDVIQRFIERLYPPAPYRFDVIGADLLGSIYERFLGKEISLDDRRRVRLEDKPEVRHAGGVYYTPSWVVSEVVERTVGPLLEGRTPRTAEQLRIVDPACGSGSFLLGALDYLIDWHERYYEQHPDVDPDRHFLTGHGRRRLTSDAKAAIVKQNIYGVDIDPQAVEVAQMSLYLKILESETSATLHDRPRLFPGPYLPSLAENLRSGNTLLAPADTPEQLLFDNDLRRRINPFDWRDPQHGFGRVFDERGGFDAVIGNPPYTRVQELRRFRPEEAELYLGAYQTATASYDIATLFVEQGLRLLRPPRGRDRGGRLGYIITRTFCETDAGQPLRQLLSGGRRVADIVDFGAGIVFPGVSAYTVLLGLTREANAQFTLTRVPSPPTPETLRAATQRGSPLIATMRAQELGGDAWPLTLPAEQALLDRLGGEHPTLRAVSGNQIFQGLITGADSIYRCADDGPHPTDPDLRMVTPASSQESIAVEVAALRPVVAGSNDLHRFRAEPTSEWIIFPYEREHADEAYRPMSAQRLREVYPRAYAWLDANRATLMERAPQTATMPWTDENWPSFSRRQNLERFAEPKVLVPYMVSELCGVVDEHRAYFVNVTTGGYGIGLSPDYDVTRAYLAALLNSELLSWVLKRYSRAWRGDYFGARKGNLERLPIVIAPEGEQEAVVAACDRCRALAEQLDAALTDTDRQQLGRLYDAAVADFDRMVFGLYAVTREELRVIRSG